MLTSVDEKVKSNIRERNHVATFKQKLKVIIALRDLEVGEIVEGSGLSWQHFSKFLRKNDPAIPSFTTIKKIAAFLKVPASYLSDDNVEINLDLSAGVSELTSRQKKITIRDIYHDSKRSPSEIKLRTESFNKLFDELDPEYQEFFEFLLDAFVTKVLERRSPDAPHEPEEEH